MCFLTSAVAPVAAATLKVAANSFKQKAPFSRHCHNAHSGNVTVLKMHCFVVQQNEARHVFLLCGHAFVQQKIQPKMGSVAPQITFSNGPP